MKFGATLITSIACLFMSAISQAESRIAIHYGIGTQYGTGSSSSGETAGFEFSANYNPMVSFRMKLDAFLIENATGGNDLLGKTAFGVQVSTPDHHRIRGFVELGLIRFFDAYEDYVAADTGEYARFGFRVFPNPRLALEASYMTERVNGTPDTNLYTLRGFTPLTPEISLGLYTEWEKETENDAIGVLYIQHF
jgi:hypothetical protein